MARTKSASSSVSKWTKTKKTKRRAVAAANAVSEAPCVEQALGSLALPASVRAGIESDDHPPLLFVWSDEKVRVFVDTIANAPQGVQPPFVMPQPLTVEAFKSALLRHVRERVPGLPPAVGNVYFPCTSGQLAQATNALSVLQFDAWFVAVREASVADCVPLAVPYTTTPRSSHLIRPILHGGLVDLWL